MRPFSSVGEMDEFMVAQWNGVVKPQDKVYHLGDIVVKGQDPSIIGRLLGHKRAVLGNHDHLDPAIYAKYFEKVCGARELDHIMLTHIPIHPQSFAGKVRGNVHGHLHNNQHRLAGELPCPPYLNVSVECVDYTPVNMDDVRKRFGLPHGG